MQMILAEDVVSLTDFARNTKQHTKELGETGRPRILTQNGKAAAVLLSPQAFEKMARDAEEYRFDEQLREAVERHRAGEPGVSGKEAFAALRKEAEARRKARK